MLEHTHVVSAGSWIRIFEYLCSSGRTQAQQGLPKDELCYHPVCPKGITGLQSRSQRYSPVSSCHSPAPDPFLGTEEGRALGVLCPLRCAGTGNHSGRCSARVPALPQVFSPCDLEKSLLFDRQRHLVAPATPARVGTESIGITDLL